MTTPLVVLISGTGSTLQALLAAAREPRAPFHVAAVIADRDAAGLGFARAEDIPTEIVRLRDLTPGGARIVHDGRFLPGMAVKLQIAPGIERPGILSWSRDGIAGVVLGDAMDGDPQGAVTRM